MRSYTRGNPIVLKGRVFTIDPVTEVSAPANAATAVFHVRHPDDSVSTFTFGVDASVTNPSTGLYLLELPPQLPVGVYRANLVTTDPVTDEWDSFEVLEEGVSAQAPSPVPVPGPCTPWIAGDDVALSCDAGVGSDTWKLDSVAAAASSLLFSLSGRLFPGVCERTVRPCRDACGCWSRAAGLTLSSSSLAYFWQGGWWGNECGDRCGCGPDSYVRLDGYPVREVVEVKVDGAVLASSAYRLVDRRRLLRLSDPGPPVVANSWPGCQDMTLSDDQPGTFSIRYRWGIEPPELGKLAAAQLACELYKATTTGKCGLPSKVTRVVRQGVTIERVPSLAALLREGSSGLQLVDAFIADVNPNGLTRRPAVFSPDVRRSQRSA